MKMQLIRMADEASISGQPQYDPTFRETLTCRETIRIHTEAAHRRLHQQRDFDALRAGRATRPGYVRLLVRMLGLHAPVEELLAPFETFREMDWRCNSGTSRAARLRQDLQVLGQDAGSIEGTPRADRLLPRLGSASAALGCAWVIEGSALGGRLLAPIIRDSLGIGPDNGGAFFAPLPSQAERWRGCCDAIETLGAQPSRRAEIVAAAVATFAAFADWIETVA